jgi:hypothetical protein
MTDGSERYVVAGLAHVRAGWFTDVARWSTVGSLPVEFVKCLSVDELRAHLASGRRLSAALLDARLPAVDRDLLAATGRSGAAPLVVVDGSDRTGWAELGAADVLALPLDATSVWSALVAHAAPIPSVDATAGPETPPEPVPGGWRAPLVAVTGVPGSGRSTVAAALAQGLTDRSGRRDDVLLVDLARRAHQGLLHDTRDVLPGLPEVVEGHRTGRLSATAIRSLTYAVPNRGYLVLLGMRNPADWVTIRHEAFAAALDGMGHAARVVVADCDHEVDGEAETGSHDLEDRNLLARHTTRAADLVVVVAQPTVSGIGDLVHALAALDRLGVPATRTLTVLNRAPRHPRRRAELAAAVAELARADPPHLGPAFLPDRRGLDAIHRRVDRLPGALTRPLASVVQASLERAVATTPDGATARPHRTPARIAPGSLGHWSDGADAALDP